MSINFRESLKVVPTEKEDKAKKIDAYRTFISETLPGYIVFMEAMNNTITELEGKGIIGKTKLRSRLKSINSALKNTDDKILDDIFGFEIVAQNERDKEILMLIIHNLFVEKYARHKNHNKSNGYFAHHCTGAVKKELDGTESSRLEKHILEAETNELKEQYRDLPSKEQKGLKKSEIFCRKPRYPILKQEILQNGTIDDKLQENFEWALGFIDQYLSDDLTLRKNMPVFEMQFKTKDVEQEVKYGKAQHVEYKKVNEGDMKRRYLQRKLVRGVDFPFEFIRNGEGNLEIEHSSDTLTNMWPFLKSVIDEYKQMHLSPVANYDMFFSKVFPDLELYVQRNLSKEPSIPTDSCNLEMVWAILKNKIINDSFVLPEVGEIKRGINTEKCYEG